MSYEVSLREALELGEKEQAIYFLSRVRYLSFGLIDYHYKHQFSQKDVSGSSQQERNDIIVSSLIAAASKGWTDVVKIGVTEVVQDWEKQLEIMAAAVDAGCPDIAVIVAGSMSRTDVGTEDILKKAVENNWEDLIEAIRRRAGSKYDRMDGLNYLDI